MKIRILFILSLAVYLASCVSERGSEAFGPPEIVKTEAVTETGEAHLSCELSEPRVDECGFLWRAEGKEWQKEVSRLNGSSFEAVLSGLNPGTAYEWYAYATAGEGEIRSETAWFTLPALPPEEVVEIPDPAFKKYLVGNFDTDGDGEISIPEAQFVRKIAVKTDAITSLEGIGYFMNLDTLICRGVDPEREIWSYEGRPGLLRSLDLGANTRLRHIECDGNLLQSLILPDSARLEYLCCARNLLSQLNLTHLPGLGKLQAFDNNLRNLDFTGCPRIWSIEIGMNLIDHIDITCCPWVSVLNLGGLDIQEIDLSGNPNLGWLGVYDTNITSLDLSTNSKLRYLDCFETDISSLDLSCCTQLYELKCWRCKIDELDISMLPDLAVFECAPMASLKKVYISEDQKIEGVTVDCSEANVPSGVMLVIRYKNAPNGKILFEDPAFKEWLLTRFDVDRDGEISLEEAAEINQIDVCSNEWNISSLQGIEFMPNLEYLGCGGDWVGTIVLNRPYAYTSKYYHWDECVGPIGTLKKVDVSHNPKLKIIRLENNSGIGETGSGSIDLSNCPLLEELRAPMCYLKYPDISACPELRVLNLSHGRGNLPDLTHNPELQEVHLDFNQTDVRGPVDVSKNPKLEWLDVGASASRLTDLSLNPKLRSLRIGWCGMSNLNLSMCPHLEELDCQGNDMVRIDLSSQKELRELNISGNPIGTLDVSLIPSLERLLCGDCNLRDLDVRGLVNLAYLECQRNSLSSLDLTRNPYLLEVYCSGNPLPSLDLSNNSVLTNLYCDHTDLKHLDLSHNPNLKDLRCNDNDLDHLDVSANKQLIYLYFERCRIKEVELIDNPKLAELDCSDNGLTALNLSRNPSLRWLVCKNNRISTLDVSSNPCLSGPNGDEITGLYCSPMKGIDGKNVLQTLWVASGQKIRGVTIERNSDHVPNETEIIIK